MKCNAWTLGLIGAGLVSLPAVSPAEERTNAVMSALAATTLSGYVDTSAQWNMGTGNAFTPNYAFSQGKKADGFNLNVVKLTLEKPIDAADTWGAGYKVDMIYGPDSNVGVGLGTQSSGTSSDFGLKQAYVVLHAPIGNGIDFKVGVWDTCIGYEVFETVNNPNFTHSYGYTIEPTTHLGVLATYVFSELLSASVGVANTVGPTINDRAFPARAESYKTYMASMTFTAPTNWGFLAGSTLSGCVINGFNSAVGQVGAADETSWYVGATLNTPVTGLKVGASYDYLGVSHQPLTEASFGSGYANAVSIYASFAATEKMTLYGRGEYATTDLGFFTLSPELRHRIVALTGTVQYDLWKNVLSRLEFRWDHAAGGGPAYGNADATGLPTKKNSYILLANIVYKF